MIAPCVKIRTTALLFYKGWNWVNLAVMKGHKTVIAVFILLLHTQAIKRRFKMSRGYFPSCFALKPSNVSIVTHKSFIRSLKKAHPFESSKNVRKHLMYKYSYTKFAIPHDFLPLLFIFAWTRMILHLHKLSHLVSSGPYGPSWLIGLL